jgi:hypothetical protein
MRHPHLPLREKSKKKEAVTVVKNYEKKHYLLDICSVLGELLVKEF